MAIFVGLMSGTSLDGIDAVAVEFAEQPRGTIRTLAAACTPLSPDIRDRILRLCSPGNDEVDALGELDAALGALFASAATDVIRSAGLKRGDITAIGSHGQTVSHGPGAPVRYSLQLGDPSVISAQTGILTVADFRSKDIALGGQGAPLVPAFHREMFDVPGRGVAVVNIGGIANVTLLSGTPNGEVLAFDTGPGNTLLDQWIWHVRGEKLDKAGAWAATGEVDEYLLAGMLGDDYFDLPPPKSTGREDFHLGWLLGRLAEAGDLVRAPADVQRTLLELTCQSILSAVERYQPDGEELLLCGGGARNSVLVERLKTLAGKRRVRTTDELGAPSAAIEAMAFGWLAHRRLRHLPGNLPSATGASRPAVLGGIFSPD